MRHVAPRAPPRAADGSDRSAKISDGEGEDAVQVDSSQVSLLVRSLEGSPLTDGKRDGDKPSRIDYLAFMQAFVVRDDEDHGGSYMIMGGAI